MKFTLSLVALCLVIGLASAVRSRSDKRHVLINRPQFDEFGPREIFAPRDTFGLRVKRAPWPLARAGGVKEGVKGGVKGGFKGQRPALEKNLRKGEYVCDNKVCKLVPGVEPAGCNGVCQYPVA